MAFAEFLNKTSSKDFSSISQKKKKIPRSHSQTVGNSPLPPHPIKHFDFLKREKDEEIKILAKHIISSGATEIESSDYLSFQTFKEIIKENEILQISFKKKVRMKFPRTEVISKDRHFKRPRNRLPHLRYFNFKIKKEKSCVKKKKMKIEENFNRVIDMCEEGKVRFENIHHNLTTFEDFLFNPKFKETPNNSKFVVLFLDREISKLVEMKKKIRRKKYPKLILNFYERGGNLIPNIMRDMTLPTFNMYNLNRKILFEAFKETVDVEDLGDVRMVYGYVAKSKLDKRFSKSVHEFIPNQNLSRFINKKVSKKLINIKREIKNLLKNQKFCSRN